MYNYINVQLICLQYNYLDSVTCIIIMNFTSTCILHNIHVCNDFKSSLRFCL